MTGIIRMAIGRKVVLVITIMIVISLFSCSYKIFTTHRYFQKEGSKEFYSQTERYCIRVPAGGKQKWIYGDHEKEIIYLYNDSSIFYISDFRPVGVSNALNIQTSFNYQNYLTSKEEKVSIQGSVDGKFWKELRLNGNIVVGFRGVVTENVKEFEKSLESAMR